MSRFRMMAAMLMCAAALVGCHKPSMEELMQAPARPVELDQLNMFVGQWEGTAECTMAGSDEKTTGKGTSTVAWEADKWLLVEHGEFSMGDKGDKMKMMGVWTWDPKAGKYRSYWFGNHGYTGQGTAEYDEATSTWTFKGKSRGMDGKEFGEKGTVKFTDKNTQEWEWASYMGMTKFMEMKGTSRKK